MNCLKIFLIFLTIIFQSNNIHSAIIFKNPDTNSCKDTCSNISGTKLDNCFCSECDTYNDCCQNIQPENIIKSERYECNVRISEYNYIYSTVKCEDWWNKNDFTRNKCEKLSLYDLNDTSEALATYLPVYSHQTNSVYRNVYCAQCNIKQFNLKKIQYFEIDASRFLFNKLYLADSDLEQQQKAIEDLIVSNRNGFANDLSFSLSQINLDNQRGCKKAIDKCAENSTDNEIRMCSSITAYRYNSYKKLIYRNKYCALCNGEIASLSCRPFLGRNLQRLFDLSKLLENQTTKMCLDELDEIDNQIKKYLTIIGHFISIISLAFLLIVYSTSKKLRNFPGKLLICLSISLLFSQLLFILSNYLISPEVSTCEIRKNIFELNQMLTSCYILGFLTHYFYLSFFSWSNVMAYDLYRMFSVLSSDKKSKRAVIDDDLEMKNIRFIKYSMYAWFLPLIICLLLVVKQFISKNSSYGFKSCFISEPISLLVFFVIPIAIILLSNIFFLLKSIISIKNVDKMTSKFLKKDQENESSAAVTTASDRKKLVKTNNNEKKRLILFLKLFILTGMTWILGLISSFHKNSVIWYIFIVLNSLQGLFIFVSFAFSPQSRKHFKNTAFYSRLSSAVSKRDQSKSDGGTNSSFLSSQKN